MTKNILVAAVLGVGFLAGTAGAADKSEVQQLFDKYSGLRDAKKYDEAIKVLDEVVKAAPKNAYSWSEGAWIFNELKKSDAAVQAAEKANEVDVNHSTGWRELGYALLKQGKHQDAIKALATAVEKDRKNFHAYGYLADAYEGVGKFGMARETRERLEKEKAAAKVVRRMD